MELFLLAAQQMLVMMLYLFLGFILVRLGLLSPEGSRDIASILVKLVIPAVIIESFCVGFSMARLAELGQSLIAAAVCLLLAILAARAAFPHKPIEHFSAAFSNAGFMGIPLVSAVLGSDSVFYIVPLVGLLNVLQWTYGVDVICEKHTPVSVRKLLWNPPVIGILAGLLLFMTGWGAHLPGVIETTLQGICALNTPLAMIVLGTYLAREKLSSLFTKPALYAVCLMRLAVIPLLSLAVLHFLPLPRRVSLAVLICAAAPVGANVAMYAQLHGKDHIYAGKAVVLSTLLSLLTLPTVTALIQIYL